MNQHNIVIRCPSNLVNRAASILKAITCCDKFVYPSETTTPIRGNHKFWPNEGASGGGFWINWKLGDIYIEYLEDGKYEQFQKDYFVPVQKKKSWLNKIWGLHNEK